MRDPRHDDLTPEQRAAFSAQAHDDEPEGGNTPEQALLGICLAWSEMTTAERGNLALLGQPVKATPLVIEAARRWGSPTEIQALDEMLASGRLVMLGGGRVDPRAIMRQHGPGKRPGKSGKHK